MLLPGVGKDDHVVDVYLADNIDETLQDHLSHESLKCAGGVLEAERHHPELIGPTLWCRERCVWSSPFLQRYLPISTLKIRRGEDSCCPQLLQFFMYYRYGLRRIFGDLVQLSKIDAEPIFPILRFCNDDWGTVW